MANFYGELIVRITSDTKGLTSGLQSSAAQVEAAGKKVSASSQTMAQKFNRVGMGLQNLGRTATQFVTLPVVAGFAVAGVAAFKFQDSLMKIQNLTGTNARQTAAWGEEIIKLGAATGQTPLALASSLYFVASSGFKGAAAMDVLRVSAKASAAGLGDVQTTADVLTSVLNAYGHENITAARATDILMKTIEVGKAEPIALANSLGRIMPVAAQLKVPFEQVGGMIAGLTLGGLSSAEAVTALRGTMVSLAAPAKMSIDELKKLGLSYKDVTASIGKNGLIATLEMLYEKTDGNMLQMRKIIPNVRALNGVFSLLGENYKRNVEITQEVTNSQGMLDKAMKNTEQTTIQKLRRAWATLQGEFIKIGSMLLPTFAKIAEKIASVVSAFNKLPDGTKQAILGFLAVSAVLGPLAMMFGSLLRGIGLIGPALSGIGPQMGAFAARMAGFDITAGALSSTGLMGGAASFGAMAAGLAAAVPVVAIAAGIATAVTLAVRAGMKKAAENTKADAANGDGWGWHNFWSETKAMFTAPGNWLSDVSGNDAQTAFLDFFYTAGKRLDQFAKTGGKAILMNRYLRDDLSKVQANKNILGDLNVEKSAAQFREWRTSLMDNLNIGKKEAEAVMRTMFGPGVAYTDKALKNVGNSVGFLTDKISKLKQDQARFTLFGDLEGLTRTNEELAKVEAKLTRIQTKSQRQAFANQANTLQIPGMKDWVGGGTGGLRIPVPQWAGKMKFPKVEVGGAKVAVQGMGKYLDAVTKTRKLTITAKISTVQDAVKGMQARLKVIGDHPTTAKLKAEKGMLEAGVKGAKGILKGLAQQQTKPKISVDTSTVAGSVAYVNQQIQSIQDKYVKVYIDAQGPPPKAMGGFIKRPEVVLVGEAGPELILPLTKPARMFSLMKQAGIANLTDNRGGMRRAGATYASPTASAPTHSGPAEVHYHSHVTVPRGIVVDDTQDFAQRLAPWQDHQLATAERRRMRGVAAL